MLSFVQQHYAAQCEQPSVDVLVDLLLAPLHQAETLRAMLQLCVPLCAGEGGGSDAEPGVTAAATPSGGLAEGVTAVSRMEAGCRLVRQLDARLLDGETASYARDGLKIPRAQAQSLTGAGSLPRSFTFVAPDRSSPAGAAGSVRREVTLAKPTNFKTVAGFKAFRRAAGIRRGAAVVAAACADSPDHVHLAPASPDGWEPEPAAAADVAADAASPTHGTPLAHGPVTVVVAMRSANAFVPPRRVVRWAAALLSCSPAVSVTSFVRLPCVWHCGKNSFVHLAAL